MTPCKCTLHTRKDHTAACRFCDRNHRPALVSGTGSEGHGPTTSKPVDFQPASRAEVEQVPPHWAPSARLGAGRPTVARGD